MGVSGCGKTTLAKAIAQNLSIEFVEADDFHSEKNVAKMKSGIALNDEDRKPWLKALNEKWRDKGSFVLSCSALNESYRKQLFEGISKSSIIFFLNGSFDLIATRMKLREGHYMPVNLLQSQFETLEEPKNAIWLNCEEPISNLVEKALQEIKKKTNL